MGVVAPEVVEVGRGGIGDGVALFVFGVAEAVDDGEDEGRVHGDSIAHIGPCM